MVDRSKIKVTLGDGTVITGHSLEEAFQKLNEMKQAARLERQVANAIKPRRAVRQWIGMETGFDDEG